jgi:hypothetical protein
MTNLDKWRLYNREMPSPANFIDWGFYSLISAALERRVFYDNETNPLYAGMYIVYVAPPGVGKGVMINKVSRTLSQFMKSDAPKLSVTERMAMRMKGEDPDRAGREFPVAADSTTFESLLQQISRAATIHKYNEGGVDRAYEHSSLFCGLDEFTSIFKLHAEDLITLLCTIWTGTNYRRETKKSGCDYVENPCFNLLSGTTPTEFAKLLKKEIIGSGLLSRTLLIYGNRNRNRFIKWPEPDAEQKAAYADLLTWVRSLKKVYGCVRYTPEAEEWLSTHFADEKGWRINNHPKLDEYYSRRLTHLHKLTMTLHYADPGYETLVPIETVQRANNILAENEMTMHQCLSIGGRNELHPAAEHIVTYLKRYHEGATKRELSVAFATELREEELLEVMQVLVHVQGRVHYDSTKQIYYIPQ